MAERKIVVIDAGHGGADAGETYHGRQEKDDNLKLALAVGKILAEHGVDVRYTRTDDTYNTPLEKALMANNAEADFFVSIHRNSLSLSDTGSGVEVLVFEDKGNPALLAKNIGAYLARLGFNNSGTVERPGLVVLRRTNIPSALVHAAYIDNDEDNDLFDQNFDEMANGIAQGILDALHQRDEDRTEYYQIQTGAYRVRNLAEEQANRLQSQGFPAFVVFENGLYKVRVGAFRNIDHAVRMEEALKNYGYNTFLVKRPAVY